MNSKVINLILVILTAFFVGAALFFNYIIPILAVLLLWAIILSLKRFFVESTLIFLMIYMPFDHFVLTHLPEGFFFYMKYLSTGLVFLISFIMFCKNWKKINLLRMTPGIYFMIAYIMVALVSAALNRTGLSMTIISLQQEFRYVPLFLALSISHFEERFIRMAVKTILVLGAINILAGLAQLCIGQYVNPLLVQRSVMVDNQLVFTGTGQFVQDRGLIFSFFPHYNVFGAYLTIIFILSVSMREFNVFRGMLIRIMPILAYSTLIFTVSRSSIIGASFGYLIFLWIVKRKKAIPAIVVFIIVIIVLLVIGNEANIFTERPQELPFFHRLIEAFSPSSWHTMKSYGRLALLELTVKTITSSSRLLFGLGPGQWGNLLVWGTPDKGIASTLAFPFNIMDRVLLADMNWASILGQFGVLGLFSFVMFLLLVALYNLKKSRSPSTESYLPQAMSMAAFIILVAISAESFFGPWFAARPIAFHLWLLAGFAVSLNLHK